MMVTFNNRTQSSILNKIEATEFNLFGSWDDDYIPRGSVKPVKDADFSDREVRRKYYFVLWDLYTIAVWVIRCARRHMREHGYGLRTSPDELAQWLEDELDVPELTPSPESIRALALDLATRLLAGLREEAMHEKKTKLAQYMKAQGIQLF